MTELSRLWANVQANMLRGLDADVINTIEVYQKQRDPNPLVAGTFRSIRAFAIRRNHLGPVAIGSDIRYSQSDYWYEAACESVFAQVPRHYGVGGIKSWCTCGFYSLYDAQMADDTAWEYSGGLAGLAVYPAVLGVIENAGLVFHHEKGLRSERMKIVGLCSMAIRQQSSAFMYSQYLDQAYSNIKEIGFTWFDTIQEMLETFPLSPRPE